MSQWYIETPKSFAPFSYGPAGAEMVWGAPGNKPCSGAGCSARQAAKPPSSHCVAFLLVIQAAKDIVTLVRVTQLLIKILIDIAVPISGSAVH